MAKKTKKNRLYIVLSGLILAVIFIITAGATSSEKKKSDKDKNLQSQNSPTISPYYYLEPTSVAFYPTAGPPDTTEQGRYSIFSPNNKYSLTIIARYSGCDYELKSGSTVVNLPGNFTKKIKCYIAAMTQNGTPETFVALHDDGLIAEEENGVLNVFRFSTGQISVYNYDYNQLEINAVSKDFSFWLFTEISKTNNPRKYIITDQNRSILKRFELPFNDRPPLYDEVNNGFLLIGRNSPGDFVSVTFDYVKLPSLELVHLLTTEPIEAPGRGCGGEKLIPAVSEIVLTQGCLTVPQKYIGKDNNIHIPLNI